MSAHPPLWNAVDAAAATGGRSRRYWEAQNVSIDSRSITKGDLFVPLKTEKRDGHEFVSDALKHGASAAMVAVEIEGLPEDAPLLLVDDTMSGLERLGMFARDRSKARRIAVTGSVGKTSTKDALKACLARIGSTHASAASHNNQWGVPLTLSCLPQETAFGIFEIGMNHAGEIAALSPQVAPEIAIITRIAQAHLAHFASTEGIARAKAEIFEGVMQGGIAIIHGQSPHSDVLLAMAQERALETITFGRDPALDCHLISAKPSGDATIVEVFIDGRKVSCELAPKGDHWIDNSLAIVACLVRLGVDLEEALQPLATLEPGAGRGARRRLVFEGGEIELIDESYNANPASVTAALSVLGGCKGRKVAILGDMLELGTSAPALHAELAQAIEAQGIDLVLTCGPLMAMLNAAIPARIRGAHAKDSASLAAELSDHLDAGDVILVKGSLGSKMALLVERIEALSEGSRPRGEVA